MALLPLPDLKPKFDLSQWVECDTECVRNYWLCKFLLPDGTFKEFAQWPGHPLDVIGLRAFLHSVPGIITFNGEGYDQPMIAAALTGLDCDTLKNLNDAIIPGSGKQGLKHWQFYKQFGIPEPTWQHIDIMEPTPGVRISLKIYGGRMHSQRMQDLPFDFNGLFDMMDRLNCSKYCGNDLFTTRQLKETIMPRLRLRHEICQQYGIEVMSKSDAQIAEAVFRAKLPTPPQKTYLPHGHTFKYVAPAWLSFVSPELQRVLEMAQRVDFVLKNPDELRVSDDEKVYDSDGREIKSGIKFSDELKGLDIKIGKSVYRMGIGGLHSKEKKQHFKAQAGVFSITDHDVNSYYPTLMLLMNMYPVGTGPAFIEVFREIYNTRLHAKAEEIRCKDEAKALKASLPKVFNKNLNNAPADAVYIGRGGAWGNPFPIDATNDRGAVIRKFREDPSTQALRNAAPTLKGKNLVCFCAPKPCHGDVLLELANADTFAKIKALEAEAESWKTISDGLKIVLNGTYGKLGSRYSFLFAPELMIRTTLSGQFALLMLIESFEASGIRVISANTDGIVVVTPVGLEWLRDQCIKSWEARTGLETEATEYTAIYNANVNNYIAFKPDGSHKAKGWYGESGVVPKASPSGKSPGMDICNDAVIAYLRDGTPVAQTIMACRDVRRFVVIKNANNPAGGAIEERTGENIGKALRFYFATGVTTGMRYAANGKLVAGSTGTKSLMDLPDEFPNDVNYPAYIEKALKMLNTDLGVVA